MLTKMKAPMGLTTTGFRVKLHNFDLFKLEVKMSVEPSAKDDESMVESESNGTAANYGDLIRDVVGCLCRGWRGRSTPIV